MKRLVITGLGCPPNPWEKLFAQTHVSYRPSEAVIQRIISLVEVLENSASVDPRVMSEYITQEIEKFAPDSIICHGFGVPFTLLSLLRLNRRGIALNTPVTAFNGAFRKFNVFKFNHPFRAQFLTYRAARREIDSVGGVFDPRLKKYFPRIRAMYRLIILFGLAETVSTFFGLDDLIGVRGKFKLKSPLQIIASRNDPYIPFEALEQLRTDFQARKFVAMDYGHFPYSVSSPTRILELIDSFEASVNAVKPNRKPLRPTTNKTKPKRSPKPRPEKAPLEITLSV